MAADPDEAALRLIVEGTVSETGTEFFRALVKNLAKAMGMVGAWVTEQRRLKKEMEVRAREEELSALFDSAMDAVVVLDAGSQITRVNPAAERLFGCTAEDLLGEGSGVARNASARNENKLNRDHKYENDSRTHHH